MQDAGYNPTFGEMVNEEFKNIYYDDIVDENDGNDNSDTTDYNSTDEEN
jgi:hypothetical protein